ncbi:MAG: CpaF family protein [Micrococcales bacterium]
MSIVRSIADSARDLVIRGQESNASDAILSVIDSHSLQGSPLAKNEAHLVAQATSILEGYGPLQEYLDNPEIEELWSNRPDELFVASGLRVERIKLELSQQDLKTILLRMLRHSGRRIDRTLPFADAALPDGSRLHVVIPEITARHWTFNLRKFPTTIMTLRDLVDRNSLQPAHAEFLSDAVKQGLNILVSGATHAGKTTLLCALLNELQPDVRLVSCEETFEIRSNLPDWIAMQTRQPNLEGEGEIPLRRLVKEALRMRPSRLVIGEVREAEALDLLIGMNSGIAGMCTIHANSPQAALTKLGTLPLLAGPNISSEFVQATILGAVHLVVQCTNDQRLGRRISNISRVSAGPNGTPIATEVLF